jgi:hypothetical protein
MKQSNAHRLKAGTVFPSFQLFSNNDTRKSTGAAAADKYS